MGETKNIARVILTQRQLYSVENEDGVFDCRVSGRFMHIYERPVDYPVTGDWVEINGGMIEGVLERRTVISREAAGKKAYSQLIAANVDYVLICMSLNENLNPRRLERYLVALSSGGAEPVIVLTKADLSEQAEAVRCRYERDYGYKTLLCCAPDGYREVEELLKKDITAVLVGSSGVGKSTMINHLLGSERIKTQDISELGARGRHTTTSRELYHLPSGASIIDTPGMREFKLDSGEVDSVFDDIALLAAECRFSDCSHINEPGCAVLAAVRAGTLDSEKLKSYQKLTTEFDRKRMRRVKK